MAFSVLISNTDDHLGNHGFPRLKDAFREQGFRPAQAVYGPIIERALAEGEASGPA
jgi:hypothetical protein